jgi:RNA polymerase sigma factor (sigma-70 family)
MEPHATHASQAGGPSAAGPASIPIDRPPRADTHTLVLRWQDQRDLAARDELVRRFMPLARRLARNYAGTGEPLEDLVAVATAGLLDALERHDPRYDVRFASFAVLSILGALKRHATGSAALPRAAGQAGTGHLDDRDGLRRARERLRQFAALADRDRRLRARTANRRCNQAAALFASAATGSRPDHRPAGPR